MSRHSKNNTANSVFTYGERKMLKDYGTLKQRVGQESQKSFENCSLCLHRVVDPMCCKEGHIFCRDCIIENLANQKKDKDEKLKRWEQYQKLVEDKKVEAEEVALAKKIEDFEKYEMDYRINMKGKGDDPFEKLNRNEKDELIKQISTTDTNPNMSRSEKVQKNFWMAETHKGLIDFPKEKPSTKLTCPAASNNHLLRMKELYKVKLDEEGELITCHVCKKQMKFQKIVMPAVCGHVQCKKCFEMSDKHHDTKDETNKKCICPVCSKSFKRDELIQLQESFSSYSSHNEVEFKKYTAAFAG